MDVTPETEAYQLRALIVEDTLDDAELEVGHLETEGFEVTWKLVQDAESMAASLREQEWDVVLSDHAMPHFDAHSALITLHDSPCDAPLIVVADGSREEDDAVKMTHEGAIDVVSKDRLSRLGVAVRRSIDEHRVRTEQRRLHARLANSERLLAESQRIGHIGSWEWEIASGALTWSLEVYNLVGAEPGGPGPTVNTLLAGLKPDVRERVQLAIDAALTEPTPDPERSRDVLSVDIEIEVGSGEERTLHATGELSCDAHGRPVRMVGTIRDITAQRLTELGVRTDAAVFVAALTNSMAEGLFAINNDREITYMNRAAEQMLGWDSGELLGSPLSELTHHRGEAGSQPTIEGSPIVRALTSGEQIEVDDDAFRKRSGEPLPVSYSVSPLTEDELTGVVVVFHDISRRLLEGRRVDEALEELAWVGRVRDALDEERFTLYAQPVVEINTRTAVQHELLLRMIDPDGNIIGPRKFLPAAEKYGLIAEIDRWVIEQAAHWVARGHPVQFNLSAASLCAPALPTFVREAFRDAGANPSDAVCELTETGLLTDPEKARPCLDRLASYGFGIALDDFGTGYGGLQNLKEMPVSMLKIDIEFVRDLTTNPQSGYVIDAVVGLAEGFGLDIVAEGVEDENTLSQLQMMGVGFAQGYLLARPAPAAEVFGQVAKAAASSP
jgi:PAS domain S-box-containing protein